MWETREKSITAAENRAGRLIAKLRESHGSGNGPAEPLSILLQYLQTNSCKRWQLYVLWEGRCVLVCHGTGELTRSESMATVSRIRSM
jgi:hypothetical protein